MRGKEKREKQTAENRGGKGRSGRDGHGESVCRYAFLFCSI